VLRNLDEKRFGTKIKSRDDFPALPMRLTVPPLRRCSSIIGFLAEEIRRLADIASSAARSLRKGLSVRDSSWSSAFRVRKDQAPKIELLKAPGRSAGRRKLRGIIKFYFFTKVRKRNTVIGHHGGSQGVGKAKANTVAGGVMRRDTVRCDNDAILRHDTKRWTMEYLRNAESRMQKDS